MIVEGNQPLAHTFSSSVIGWICYIICINLFKIYRYKSNLNRSKALVKLLQLLAISTINHIFWDFDSGTITPLIFVHSVQMEYYECKTRFYSESIHQNVSSLLANNYSGLSIWGTNDNSSKEIIVSLKKANSNVDLSFYFMKCTDSTGCEGNVC